MSCRNNTETALILAMFGGEKELLTVNLLVVAVLKIQLAVGKCS